MRGWPLQTDLPHLHMPCPEIHGPWWFQRSSNHRPKYPPINSEPSLKSLCCCQPWQELKEAPNCPNYQKLWGMNRERHTEGEHSEAERREKVKQQERKGEGNCQTKRKRHNLAWLQIPIWPKFDNSTGKKSTYMWTVMTLVKLSMVGKKFILKLLLLFGCLHNSSHTTPNFTGLNEKYSLCKYSKSQ